MNASLKSSSSFRVNTDSLAMQPPDCTNDDYTTLVLTPGRSLLLRDLLRYRCAHNLAWTWFLHEGDHPQVRWIGVGPQLDRESVIVAPALFQLSHLHHLFHHGDVLELPAVILAGQNGGQRLVERHCDEYIRVPLLRTALRLNAPCQHG